MEFIIQARKYHPAPTVSHGQALLWSGREFGVQGVTELHQCERVDDTWLEDVQNEVRAGALSEDNYHFLHGRPTTVPGSWCKGKVLCGQATCKQLAKPHLPYTKPPRAPQTRRRGKSGASPTRKSARQDSTHDATILLSRDPIHQQECDICKRDRASRALVCTGPNDPRLSSSKFSSATAIFPNNDIKYHVNKLRAQNFAARHKEVITYAVASDKPANDTLKQRSSASTEKASWLQRHDRESGDLYGMLPLIRGAPYALTDHQDRNPENNSSEARSGTYRAASGTGKN